MPFKVGVLLLLACALFAQTLTVTAPPDHKRMLTVSELAKMPRTTITVNEHNKETHYEGVLLRDVLASAGAPLGEKLKGRNMTAVAYLSGKDGYHAVLALAEIEPRFQENQILVADTVNRKPFTEEQGGFRLIVPEDQHGARWVRMLERIDVILVAAPASNP
jgi:hypothetical protein